MTPPSQLERAAAMLQDAIEHQDFATARIGAQRYAELLRASMAELGPAEAEARMKDGGRFLESVRRKACVARAKIEVRIKRLERAAGYRPPAYAVNTWSVQG